MIIFTCIILGLGLTTGFIAGFLGFGGGVLLGPALILLVPIMTGNILSLEQITGITAAQGLVGSVSSWYFHRKHTQSLRLGCTIGIPMGLGAMTSSCFILQLGELWILATFALMLSFALFISITVPKFIEYNESNNLLLFTSSLSIGLLNGVIGQGGAFFFIPFFAYIIGLPIRQVVSSAGIIGAFSVSSSLMPRLFCDLIPWLWVIIITPTVIIGSYIGTHLHHQVSDQKLRWFITFFLGLSLVQIINKITGSLF
ncbi:sulfite exporter TauE/SafE family protein [Spartinivicinus ruber]|uniref:sulfite exporter TauE/SafE family protein n=1 Tax=Spartinivicinus ruber TaxID=2683272 RepID=UPI0013D8CD0A|nr:sulfite exporter TauE/SafE family protein [Spartinivicinus ruber]